jgi:hypothetical protein
MSLRRYWFTFETLPYPSPLNLGCGITATSYDDAIGLMRQAMFGGGEGPAIRSCIEDVDVSTLDPKHVRPNMGLVVVRGIWFPQAI